MAKQLSCPLCGNKVTPDGSQIPNHLESESGGLCPMSTRPVPNHEDDGPVTDGAGPAGPTNGPAGTSTP